MNLTLSLEPHDTLTVHLVEGAERTTVSAHPSRAGVASLLRAVREGLTDGYGECFWPGVDGGQYWWIFKRTDMAMEVIAMWTRGGVSIWEHVFRATDGATWLEDRLDTEVDRLALRPAD